MFQYYALLWARYEFPVFPVTVYLRRGRSALSEEEYRVDLFGREQLRFRYAAVALARFEGQEYVEKGSPVAAALAALMSRREAREPLKLRLLMMERVALSGLDDARKFLLLNLIETYFKLAGDERQKFEGLLSRDPYREVKEMQLTWAEEMIEKGRKEGLKKGRQEGRQVGMIEGKREALLRQLTTKFGPLPEETVSRVQALESLEKLDDCLDQVLTATSLAKYGALVTVPSTSPLWQPRYLETVPRYRRDDR